MGNFHGGKVDGTILQQKLQNAFHNNENYKIDNNNNSNSNNSKNNTSNRVDTLCYVGIDRHTGKMNSIVGENCTANIPFLHGFFHITNLNFFRSPIVYQTWLSTFRDDCFLCRTLDDQVALTIPLAMLSPERTWDMYGTGIMLNIYHNGRLDGKRHLPVGGFIKYWNQYGPTNFTTAYHQCPVTEGG